VTTSRYPRISRDGSTAVFNTVCLLPNETNGYTSHVYAVDLNTVEIEIVSVSSEGELGNGPSGEGESAGISADGRYVVFGSNASNLTPDGVATGIYLRDRLLDETELVSLTHEDLPTSGYYPAISADGRWVVFTSYASNVAPDDDDGGNSDLFIRDRELGTTEILTVTSSGESVEEHGASDAFISDDGRYVAFWHSEALSDDDIDPSSWSNAKRLDVYVRDRQTGINRLVSMAPDGFSEGNSAPLALAPDGSWVMFAPFGSDSASHYYNTSSYEHFTSTIIANLSGTVITFEPVVAAEMELMYIAGWSDVSADGRYVAFNDFFRYVDHVALNPSGDPVANSYVLDRNTGEITLVTASDDGTPGVVPDYVMGETTMVDYGEISISGDGKRAVFTSIQYGMVDTYDFTIQCPNTPHLVYLRDCQPTDAGVSDGGMDAGK
jgi:Tol biopolymer transport system component